MTSLKESLAKAAAVAGLTPAIDFLQRNVRASADIRFNAFEALEELAKEVTWDIHVVENGNIRMQPLEHEEVFRTILVHVGEDPEEEEQKVLNWWFSPYAHRWVHPQNMGHLFNWIKDNNLKVCEKSWGKFQCEMGSKARMATSLAEGYKAVMERSQKEAAEFEQVRSLLDTFTLPG